MLQEQKKQISKDIRLASQGNFDLTLSPVAGDNRSSLGGLPEDGSFTFEESLKSGDEDEDRNLLKTSSVIVNRGTANKHRQRITRSQSFFKKLMSRHDDLLEEPLPEEDELEDP